MLFFCTLLREVAAGLQSQGPTQPWSVACTISGWKMLRRRLATLACISHMVCLCIGDNTNGTNTSGFLVICNIWRLLKTHSNAHSSKLEYTKRLAVALHCAGVMPKPCRTVLLTPAAMHVYTCVHMSSQSQLIAHDTGHARYLVLPMQPPNLQQV